jgi:hypothetical protein
MSKTEKIITTTFQVWSIGLGVITFVALAVTIVNLITGNYCGTASFEF